MKEVIDTRFLAEYSNSNSRNTRENDRKMDNLIAKKEGILPTIVIAEMVQITCGKMGKDMAGSLFQSLIQSGLEIQSLTPQIAQQAGLYKCTYREFAHGQTA